MMELDRNGDIRSESPPRVRSKDPKRNKPLLMHEEVELLYVRKGKQKPLKKMFSE
jgi:hypothetical protein